MKTDEWMQENKKTEVLCFVFCDPAVFDVAFILRTDHISLVMINGNDFSNELMSFTERTKSVNCLAKNCFQ